VKQRTWKRRVQVGTLLEATADLELLSALDELGQPFFRLADKDGWNMSAGFA
jgi:hypothetical protein